jgi:hypothetical protein
MKKNILTLFLLIFHLYVQSQVIFDHNFAAPGSYARVYNFNNAGYKYGISDRTKTTLYNIDYSIYKVINYPVFPNFQYNLGASITDMLVNNDTMIEVILGRQDTTNQNSVALDIIDETGNIINTYPQTSSFQIFDVGGNTYKLMLTYYDTLTQNYSHYEFYSLPGSLPCNSCGGISGISNKISITPGSVAFPNPSSEHISIRYTLFDDEQIATIHVFNVLGEIVQNYKVDHSFNQLEIETGTFSPGVYTYTIEGKNNRAGGKFIVQ